MVSNDHSIKKIPAFSPGLFSNVYNGLMDWIEQCWEIEFRCDVQSFEGGSLISLPRKQYSLQYIKEKPLIRILFNFLSDSCIV